MNHKSKGFAYALNFERLKQSIKDEYFYEALMIEFAMIEDRIYTLFFKLGLCKIDFCLNSNQQKIFENFMGNRARFIDLFSRLKYLLKLIELPISFDQESKTPPALAARSILIPHKEIVINLVGLLVDWSHQRNVFVHSLLSGSLNLENDKLKVFVKNGLLHIRNIDKLVRKIKSVKPDIVISQSR